MAGTPGLLTPAENHGGTVSLRAPRLSSSEANMGNGDTHMFSMQGEEQPGHSSHSGGW